MGTLWYGGVIYTLEKELETVEAVYTENDVIVAVGNKKELENQYSLNIENKIDLHGSTMLPGFVDSHIHLIGHGESLIRLDLSNVTSKQELLEKVKAYANEMNEQEWIIGEGWNENQWIEKDPITRFELDSIIPNRPVLLKRVCRHAIVTNSFALDTANITEQTINPKGGVIEKNAEGHLTGLLKDQAQNLVLDHVPVVSEAHLEKAMRTAIENCYRLGIVGVHTEDLNYYGGFQRTYGVFKKLIEEEQLKFRAHLLIHYGVIDEWKEKGHSYLSGTDYVEFGAMKIFADGSLGSRTALLSFGYHDDPATNGVAIHTETELVNLVKKARDYELPVAIHAIGDAAFEMVLNAIEEYPCIGKGRDRIIHAQILKKDLIDRVKDLPVVLDIQPSFVTSDFPWVIERIGEKNMKYCYAWKTLLKEGIPCAGGSDAPIENVDPFLGIYAAVTRKNPNDSKQKVYMEDERLSVYEAISLFTKGSAFAACRENKTGMIKKGFLADFTIIDRDPFYIKEDELLQIKVEKTVVGSKVVYSASTGCKISTD